MKKKPVETKKVETKKKVTKSVKNEVKKSKPKKEISKNESNELYALVGRVALKNAVDLVAMALPSKEYNDAKSGIFIETKYVDDEPMLFLTANSLNVFISHGIKLQDDMSEGFVVPKGKDFTKIVSGLQVLKNQIELTFVEEDNQFTIGCGDDYNSSIQHFDSTSFVFPPTLEDIEENDVINIPVKFIREALDKVAFSCSSDATIPELTGVLIEQTKDLINIVGGDGNRLSHLMIKSKVKNPKRVIVGVKYLQLFNTVLKTLEVAPTETLTLYLSDEKIFFVVDNTIIGIQVYAGEYPITGGYEQFDIPEKDCEITLHVEKAKLLEKLDLAVLHNNSLQDPISMKLEAKEKKKIGHLCNYDSSSNKFEIEFGFLSLKNETKGDVEIVFAPSFLYDVIKSIDGKEVEISFQSEQGPAVVRPIDYKDGEYIHVFSLV